MSIFTDRDLERLASLRTNWRKEFLSEIVRLRQERDIVGNSDHGPSTEAIAPGERDQTAGQRIP
jgi:hypothetical protein